jgi:4-hydroxybenzoate polyprenyltransferase
VLATASHSLPAQAVARHLGIFSQVLATDAERNLAGAKKRDALVALFGAQGFDYAGNARPDLAIWPWARRAIVVNPERGIEAGARSLTEVESVFSDRKPVVRVVLRAIRVHQWVKNLLVFLPLVAAHAWTDPTAIAHSLLAFAGFSLCASAIYLINDALDLDADRAHSRKRFRPLASGDLSLTAGAALALVLLVAGLGIGSLISSKFLLVLSAYVITTCAYSFALKSYVLIDVLLLAALYTVRVIGGAAAIAVMPTFWLMALSMLLFFSLALVKRCAELISLRVDDKPSVKGRDYHLSDLPQLTSLGVAASYGAVVILALYVHSPEVAIKYRHPQALWMLCPLLLYWTGRMWIVTGRGQMHDDPIIYSAKDRPSWIVVGLGLLMILLAL